MAASRAIQPQFPLEKTSAFSCCKKTAERTLASIPSAVLPILNIAGKAQTVFIERQQRLERLHHLTGKHRGKEQLVRTAIAVHHQATDIIIGRNGSIGAGTLSLILLPREGKSRLPFQLLHQIEKLLRAVVQKASKLGQRRRLGTPQDKAIAIGLGANFKVQRGLLAPGKTVRAHA